jgi:protein-S-isoprenylcysteine O-methyltransferase Ste14
MLIFQRISIYIVNGGLGWMLNFVNANEMRYNVGERKKITFTWKQQAKKKKEITYILLLLIHNLLLFTAAQHLNTCKATFVARSFFGSPLVDVLLFVVGLFFFSSLVLCLERFSDTIKKKSTRGGGGEEAKQRERN